MTRRHEGLERGAVQNAKSQFDGLTVAAMPAEFYGDAKTLQDLGIDAEGEALQPLGIASVQFPKGFQALVVIKKNGTAQLHFMRHKSETLEAKHYKAQAGSLHHAGELLCKENLTMPGILMVAPYFGFDIEPSPAAPVEEETQPQAVTEPPPPVEPSPEKPLTPTPETQPPPHGESGQTTTNPTTPAPDPATTTAADPPSLPENAQPPTPRGRAR